jgi:hypothetical protein
LNNWLSIKIDKGDIMGNIDELKNKIDLAKRLSLLIKSISSHSGDIDYSELLKVSELYPELLLYINDKEKIKIFLTEIKDVLVYEIIKESKANYEKNIRCFIDKEDVIYKGTSKKDTTEEFKVFGFTESQTEDLFSSNKFEINENKDDELFQYYKINKENLETKLDKLYTSIKSLEGISKILTDDYSRGFIAGEIKGIKEISIELLHDIESV